MILTVFVYLYFFPAEGRKVYEVHYSVVGVDYTFSRLVESLMDEGTIKTKNPKCRLNWCLIECIDWR